MVDLPSDRQSTRNKATLTLYSWDVTGLDRPQLPIITLMKLDSYAIGTCWNMTTGHHRTVEIQWDIERTYTCAYIIIEGSLETKVPTIWTDEKQHSQEEAEPGRNSDV